MRILWTGLIPLLLCSCGTIPTEQDKKLADSFNRELYDSGKGTPWEYAGNQTAAREIFLANKILTGKLIPSDPEQYRTSREALKNLQKEIAQGKNWPKKIPSEVKLPFLAKSGEGFPDWQNALTFKGEYPIGEMEPLRLETIWKIGWNRHFLYVFAKFRDAEIVPKRPNPWQGDALEVFLRTDLKYRCYWEIIVNPSGFVFDGLQQNNRWGSYIGNRDDSIAGLKKRVFRKKDAYTIELAIPWLEMPGYTKGNLPEKGEKISFMLIRCNNGKQSSCLPILYGGHNIFGHITGILE